MTHAHNKNRRLFTSSVALAAALILAFSAASLPAQAARQIQWFSDAPARQTPLKQVRKEVDAAPLTPFTTGYAECDQLVAQILSQIITPKMDTYDKVRACYDYLINNCEYDHGSGSAVSIDFSQLRYLGPIMACEILETGTGVCDNYACALAAMLRALGLNAYVKHGSVNGYGHAWTVLNVSGKEYLIDAMMGDGAAGQSKNDLNFVRQLNDLMFMTDYAASDQKYVDRGVYYNYYTPLNEMIAEGDTPEHFDPEFYASAYGDIAAAIGTDPIVLYAHYLNYGKQEGRLPNSDAR